MCRLAVGLMLLTPSLMLPLARMAISEVGATVVDVVGGREYRLGSNKSDQPWNDSITLCLMGLAFRSARIVRKLDT